MVPKYRQLADRLRAEIEAGPGGGRLLSERELAAVHKVSRQTVRQALALLEKEGILEKRRGSGSYAVSGAGGSRGKVAFLLPGGRDSLPGPVFQEIASVCAAQRYEAEFYATGGRIGTEREILERLREALVRGLCVVGTRTAVPNPNTDLYRQLRNAGTALVFAGSPYRGLEDVVSVSMDNVAGGYLAVRHLISGGHLHIACLFGSGDMQDLERYAGCVSAIRDYGLKMEEDCYFWLPCRDPAGPEPSSDIAGGAPDFRREVLFPEKTAARIAGTCSGAICRDQTTAALLAAAMRRQGLRPPEDFEIVCFRDDLNPEGPAGAYTSLVCAGQHPGRVATDCLLRILAGRTVPPVRLNWRLEPSGEE